jgi:hypothetical protein
MNPFNDIKPVKHKTPDQYYGRDILSNVSSLKMGTGAKAFKGDESGIWLGANKFADAPFSVDIDGNVVATSATFSEYATDDDLDTLDGNALKKDNTTQILSGKIIVGNNKVIIDGANKRIIINDGDDNRVLIGLF